METNKKFPLENIKNFISSSRDKLKDKFKNIFNRDKPSQNASDQQNINNFNRES